MSKEAYNKIISKLQKLEDYHFFGLAERYLQLSIEILLDVGKLLIVIKGLKRPEENQEIFSALRDEKIISEKLADNLMGVANFRNILVHDYEKIDREIVYEKLRNNLDDFENFKKEIAGYVNKYI